MRSSFFSLAILSLAAALAGCSGKTTGGSPDAGSVVPGCVLDPSLSCGGGYVALSCDPSVNPAQSDSSVTCGGAADAGSEVDYCCISTTPPGLACGQDTTVSCPNAGQVGYQCLSGASPIGSSSTFQCTYQSSNPAGTTDSYCCSG